MKLLRPYQDAALKSLWDWLYTKQGNPLVVAPVGAGKSLLIAEFIRQAHEKYPRTRIVMLCHVQELLQQNMAELLLQYPSADAGFYSASIGQKRLHNDITFAGIQSVHSKIAAFNRAPEIIIIDEAHLISHNDATQYRRFIDAALAANPNCKVIGFTGTPFRQDSGRLDEGDGRLFDGVCYEINIGWMIEEGYLCKPVVPNIQTRMNVAGVATRKGDYAQGALERAIDTEETNRACVQEIITLGADRKKWLVFTAGLSQCEHVRDMMRSYGITCEMVTGDTLKAERDNIIERYRKGKIRCLVNVSVLTTGFNVPDIDLLAFMRPTKSPVLYIQSIGRGIRPIYVVGFDLITKEGRLASIEASGKKDCLCLDFGNVIKNLGAIDAIDIRKRPSAKSDEKKEKKEAVTKRCPACAAECYISQKYCYECGYNFITAGINAQADNESYLLSTDEPPAWHDVTQMKCYYNEPKTAGKLPTMKVVYYSELEKFNEFLCFEHPAGYALDKARHWFKNAMPDMVTYPASVREAIDCADLFYPPKRICVRRQKANPKYFEVFKHEWESVQMPIIQTIEEYLDDEIPF